jgi:hypothetical protein
MMVLLVGPILDLFDNRVFICGLNKDDYIAIFLPYLIIYSIYLLYLHRNLSWPVFILSLQETIFMIPYYIGFFIKFIFRNLGFKILTFKVTPKKVVNISKVDELLPTIFLLIPYIIYLTLGFNSIIFSITQKTFNWVDGGWLCFISFQMINPLLFVIQSLII